MKTMRNKAEHSASVECSHLEQVQDDYTPNKLYYCQLLSENAMGEFFQKIARALRSTHSKSILPPNQECPWVRFEECDQCPFYEPISK